MSNPISARRGVLQALLGLGGATTVLAAASPRAAASPSARPSLPDYARAMGHRSLKQSSTDPTGGNADSWPIAPGATREVFASDGPGVLTHIWFTIAADSAFHLKELVLRVYWDGNTKPSVEAPVGDFFGLNLGQYVLYQSAFLNCSPVKALNAYFAMPFRKSARITVTNEGSQKVGAFYSNIDYQLVPSLPDDALYFHAQYRQSAPPTASSTAWAQNWDNDKILNVDGKDNHVFLETRGRGHLLGRGDFRAERDQTLGGGTAERTDMCGRIGVCLERSLLSTSQRARASACFRISIPHSTFHARRAKKARCFSA
jgi:hypothetical protein